MYVDVDIFEKCLGGGIVRNRVGSGEAGSGRRASLMSFPFTALGNFFGPATDFTETNVSHGRDLDFSYTNIWGRSAIEVYHKTI